MAIDDVDQRLIQLLRTDARMPVAKLAARAGISRATATARIERLRRDGIIAGFTVVLQSNVETSGVRAITSSMTAFISGKPQRLAVSNQCRADISFHR